ncbi:hypothetical protein OSC27_06110 [Microbacterium sp. STN6]|uniref:hypothetical protein n=1 Tax=Microbacterium sp. STN6 TaxID=2995588 RepID=UPI002260BDC5|nr:hypothetical protein [Microbacterium sp. STN6]MCX7521851.1 hypothetical protein [Microbacterium sp. STN6]
MNDSASETSTAMRSTRLARRKNGRSGLAGMGGFGLRLATGAAVAALVVTGTVGAMPTSAVAAQRADSVAALSAAVSADTVASASLRSSVADDALTSALATARDEVARAQALLASSAGKASEEGRAALTQSIADVTAQIDNGSAYSVLGSVMSLRESEKAVSDSVSAWEHAEAARQAAAAAAAAAAQAAREYQVVHSSATVSSHRTSVVTRSAARAAAPYLAPGVSATPPANDSCGPCPGATLVLIQGYWGCPS